MKYFLLIVIAAWPADFVYSQDKPADCSLFKAGHFAYRESASGQVWKIKRTKQHQTEKNEQTGVIIKNRIEWISPCEYKLTQTWTNKKEWRNRNAGSRIFSISSVDGNTYQYSCTCRDGTAIGGTIVKMID